VGSAVSMGDTEPTGCMERIGMYGGVGAAGGTVWGVATEALKLQTGAAAGVAPKAYWADAAGRLASRTGRSIVALSLLAAAECSMATIR